MHGHLAVGDVCCCEIFWLCSARRARRRRDLSRPLVACCLVSCSGLAWLSDPNLLGRYAPTLAPIPTRSHPPKQPSLSATMMSVELTRSARQAPRPPARAQGGAGALRPVPEELLIRRGRVHRLLLWFLVRRHPAVQGVVKTLRLRGLERPFYPLGAAGVLRD